MANIQKVVLPDRFDSLDPRLSEAIRVLVAKLNEIIDHVNTLS